VPGLGAQSGQRPAVTLDHSENTMRSQVRSRPELARESSKRVQTGEPNCVFQIVRYLIDFITILSEVSSGLGPPDSDPDVDSNSSTDQHPPNESARAHHVCRPPSRRQFTWSGASMLLFRPDCSIKVLFSPGIRLGEDAGRHLGKWRFGTSAVHQCPSSA
jgi:hypothetical protein